MAGLHPLRGWFDGGVGGGNDVRGGAVVLRQVHRLGLVVRLEAANEAHRRASEGVDVLVVVAHREQAELVVFVGQRSASQGGDQFVLLFVYILVFVHQYPAEAGQEPRSVLVQLLRRQSVAAQQRHRLAHHFLKGVVVQSFRAVAEAGADQAHGETMAGVDENAAGIVANQFTETAANLHRRMAVVGQGDDALRVLAPHPQQVGDAMHQDTSLAGTGAGQHQHVGAFPIVGDDALLVPVQALHDAAPGFSRGLAGKSLLFVRQPAAQEVVLAEAKVVHRQTQRLGHGAQGALGELRHHMDLQHLVLVVEVERHEVRAGEAPTIFVEVDGHGWSEHSQSLVEAHHLLLVQPQQGAVQQLGEPLRVRDPGFQRQVGLQRLHQLAESRLGQQVRAPAAGRQTAKQVIEQTLSGAAAAQGRLRQRLPWTLQGHPDGIGIGAAQAQAALAAAFVASIPGDAAQDAPYMFRQGLRVAVVLDALGNQA